MKKLITVVAALTVTYLVLTNSPEFRKVAEPPSKPQEQTESQSSAALLTAIRVRKSDTQVTGEGVVMKILPDDNEGSRHQRFILRISTGQTLLVAHNIDLAPRLSSLKTGDSVSFHGVYEWNPKGGVIHWTHRDPSGHRESGWLRHAGKTYE